MIKVDKNTEGKYEVAWHCERDDDIPFEIALLVIEYAKNNETTIVDVIKDIRLSARIVTHKTPEIFKRSKDGTERNRSNR
jgi:hypothetical protein